MPELKWKNDAFRCPQAMCVCKFDRELGNAALAQLFLKLGNAGWIPDHRGRFNPAA